MAVAMNHQACAAEGLQEAVQRTVEEGRTRIDRCMERRHVHRLDSCERHRARAAQVDPSWDPESVRAEPDVTESGPRDGAGFLVEPPLELVARDLRDFFFEISRPHWFLDLL